MAFLPVAIKPSFRKGKKMIQIIPSALGVMICAFSFVYFSVPAAANDDWQDQPLPFYEGAAVDDSSLSDMRGTALDPEVLGIAVFNGVSAHNTNNGSISGGNVITAGAFSESSGLSTIIQNSGNNVVIQSATILNVNFE
jgi:hypothetical protein